MIPCSTNVAMGLTSSKESGFYQVRFVIYILIVMNKYNFILFKSSFVILYNLRLPCDKLDFFSNTMVPARSNYYIILYSLCPLLVTYTWLATFREWYNCSSQIPIYFSRLCGVREGCGSIDWQQTGEKHHAGLSNSPNKLPWRFPLSTKPFLSKDDFILVCGNALQVCVVMEIPSAIYMRLNMIVRIIKAEVYRYVIWRRKRNWQFHYHAILDLHNYCTLTFVHRKNP